MNLINRSGERILMKGATLLVTMLMLAVINVWPLLDVGYDAPSSVHVEEPDGSLAHHGANHDHALCGVMGSAHVLPGATQAIAIGHSNELENAPPARDRTEVGIAFTVHHSRAPPSA